MCDQTEILYKNGDIVWVKLGNIFWPGQVCDIDSIADDVSNSFKKKPIAAVQFFGEDKYEFVKSLDHISGYNGRRKNDFLKKGIDLFRKQKDGASFMNKFPDDVRRAEQLTGGNPDILNEPQFLPQEKQSYRALFDGNKSVDSKKGGPGKRGRPPSTPKANGRQSMPAATTIKVTPRPITHPRFVKGEADHDVRIRQQGEESPSKEGPSPKKDMPYKCQLCSFTASRLNVIVLHNKFHADAVSTSKPRGRPKKTPKSHATPTTSAAKAKTAEKDKAVVLEVEEPAVAESPAGEASQATRGSKRAVKRKIWGDEVVTPPKKTGKAGKKATEKPQPETAVDKRKGKASDKSNDNSVKSPEPAEKKLKTPEKANDKNKSKSSAKSPDKKAAGKRKGSQAAVDKNAKKSKDDEEIREKLLADWDDEDAEQEQKEVELLKKKPASETEPSEPVVVADPAKETSCFDFDDAKDAILDSELEKRAKKFVESRKTPRVQTEERIVVEEEVTVAKPEETAEETETDARPEDFDLAIDSLLADTKVPQLPQIPDGKTTTTTNSLPDVVLDSSLVDETKAAAAAPITAVSSMEFSSGDHDYSARRLEAEEDVDGDLLDIDSMPVVMTDDIIFPVAEPESRIDLAPASKPTAGHSFVFSENDMMMTQSAKSVVKAVRSTTADRSKQPPKTLTPIASRATKIVPPMLTPVKKLPEGIKKVTPIRTAVSSPKGIAGGKYIIVQSPSGQQSRLTIAPVGPSKTIEQPVPGTSHKIQSVGGGKVVILTKPQGQQKILTAVSPAQQKALAAGKHPVTQQRIVSATGQILTPVSGRGPIPAGAKITPITGNQMRVMTGTTGVRHSLGPKIQMQSLQTKVVLPSMQKMAPKKMLTAPIRPGQGNTIVLQAAQGAPSTSSVQARAAAQLNQLTRPRLLKTPPAAIRPGFTPKILQQRSTFQPRMLAQKPRAAGQARVGVVSGMQAVTEVVGFTTQPQTIQKISQPQTIQKVSQPQTIQKTNQPQIMTIIPQPKRTAQPIVQRVALTQPKPVARQKTFTIQTNQRPAVTTAASTNSNNVTMATSHEPPPLTPFQTSLPSLSLADAASLSLSNFSTTSADATANSVLTPEQLAQLTSTSGNTLGDGATYVLLTIDEAGNLHPYNNQSLISYDGSDQSGQTLYIDSSSLESGGVLDNMILTIDNSAAQAGMSMSGPTENTWMPSASQDILAAALANTDVFQPEVSMQDQCIVDTSSLLASIPSTLLLPSLNRVVTTAANVSETSLTLNQPIMSPLEVGSSFPTPPLIASPHPPPPYEATTSLEGSSLEVAQPVLMEEEATYHPSMPLLSEEPVDSTADQLSFENANGTEAFHTETELPPASFEQLTFEGAMAEATKGSVESQVPSESADFVADSASEPIVTTSSIEVSFESNMLTTTSLTNETSAMMQPFLADDTTPVLPQSMPLLCDDSVPESAGDQSQDSQASTLSEPTFE